MTELEILYSDDTDCSETSRNDEVDKEIQKQIKKAIEDGLLNAELNNNGLHKKQLTRKKNEDSSNMVNNESEWNKSKIRKLNFFKKRKLKDNTEMEAMWQEEKQENCSSEDNIGKEETEEDETKHICKSNGEEEKYVINDLDKDTVIYKNEEVKETVDVADSYYADRAECKKGFTNEEIKSEIKKKRKIKSKSKRNCKKKSVKREKKRKSNAEEENLKINKVQLFFESDYTDETDGLSASSLSDIELLNKEVKTSKDHFNFLTWNTDGLCDILVKTRMLKIIEIIKKTKVSVAFLQEVINDTIDLIKLYLSDEYEIIEAEDSCGKKLTYFCLTLILKKHFKILEKETFWFYGTVMGRHAIKILVHPVNNPDQKILLINTHLESSSSFKQERICQLKQCIIDMLENQKKEINTIIFGGDLNVRDDEIKSIEFPSNILDVWEYLGSPKNCQYTWNCLMNRNFCKNFFFFKPRCRFDRVYWIKNHEDNYAKPITIKKVGNKRLSKQHHMLPSDHYGLVIKFNIV